MSNLPRAIVWLRFLPFLAFRPGFEGAYQTLWRLTSNQFGTQDCGTGESTDVLDHVFSKAHQTESLSMIFHYGLQVVRDHLQALFIGNFLGIASGKDPGIAYGRSSYENGIAACGFFDGMNVLYSADVTVAQHGNANGLFYLSDGLPVRFPAVSLGSRSPVHGDGRDAICFQDMRYVRIIQGLLVPPQAYLGGDREGNFLDESPRYAAYFVWLAQQGRSPAAGRDTPGGTPKIDIDDVWFPLEEPFPGPENHINILT